MENKTKQKTPQFNDARSKKVMIVAHCILNQNARISDLNPDRGLAIVNDLIAAD